MHDGQFSLDKFIVREDVVHEVLIKCADGRQTSAEVSSSDESGDATSDRIPLIYGGVRSRAWTYLGHEEPAHTFYCTGFRTIC